MIYQLSWQTSFPGGWSPIRQVVGDINSVHQTYNTLVELSRHTQAPLNAEVRSLIPTDKDYGTLVYKTGDTFVTNTEQFDTDPLEGYRNRLR